MVTYNLNKASILVLNHQNINDVLNDILNRLEVIEKEIGIKPMDNTLAAAVENIKEAVGNLGISAEEAGRALQTTMQRLYNNLGCNAIIKDHNLCVEGGNYSSPIIYEFKNNEYLKIPDEDIIFKGGWLDNDFNE